MSLHVLRSALFRRTVFELSNEPPGISLHTVHSSTEKRNTGNSVFFGSKDQAGQERRNIKRRGRGGGVSFMRMPVGQDDILSYK